MSRLITRRRALIGAATSLLATPAIIRPASAQLEACLPAFCWAPRNVCSGPGGAAPLDGIVTTGAWSSFRKLYTAYGGAFYNLTGNDVSTWYNQSVASRDLVYQQTSPFIGPLVSCTGGRPTALQFDSITESSNFVSTAPFADFITATDGYMIASFYNTSFTENGSPGYNNPPIIQSSGQNAGLTVSLNSGSPLLYAGNFEPPNVDVSKSITTNVSYVGEWRHEGGTLYERLNGVGEVSTAAGPTALGGFLNVGGRFTRFTITGYIWEVIIAAVVPSLSERNAMVQALGVPIGASV